MASFQWSHPVSSSSLRFFVAGPCGQRPVERPDRALRLPPQRLVRGHHVPQRGRIVDHVVPRQFVFIGKPLERQVGCQPGRVFEARKGRRALDDVGRQKGRRGPNYDLGRIFGVFGRYAQLPPAPRHAVNHRSRADVRAQPLHEAPHDPPVALGPRRAGPSPRARAPRSNGSPPTPRSPPPWRRNRHGRRSSRTTRGKANRSPARAASPPSSRGRARKPARPLPSGS